MNTGKIVLKGQIELLSPLHIGNGENEYTDMDIIIDESGSPFIPFTSFIGAVKHELADCSRYDRPEKELNTLFGYTKDEDSLGSIILGSDLFLSENSTCIVITRDGIKIDLATGIVKEGAKYDFQAIDKGAKFDFELESSIKNSDQKTLLLQHFSTIVSMIKRNTNNLFSDGLRVGAKTNSGLGKISITNEKCYEYDFEKAADISAWLERKTGSEIELYKTRPFVKKENDLVIEAFLDLKTSLIQRSYNEDPNKPDSSHIQSGKKDILEGKGTKGAITARARRIINTIWKENEDAKIEFLDKFFGYVHDKKDENDKRKNKDSKKAKLQVEERVLPGYIAELQSRIKIDRFTGGTINSALFDSMPLFNTKEMKESADLNNKTQISITVKNCSEAEAGLMLLVLKDIWTGDLAIGGEKGIGRGVFNGVSAKIKFHNEVIELRQRLENLSELQKYVEALVKIAEVKNERVK